MKRILLIFTTICCLMSVSADNKTIVFNAETGCVYDVKVVYSGVLTVGYINEDLSGYELGRQEKADTAVYTVPCVNGKIDLSVSSDTITVVDNPQIYFADIEKQRPKASRAKRKLHHIGDSTSAGNGAWAVTLAKMLDEGKYSELTELCDFCNDGMGGRQLRSYYIQGRFANVLCDICPDDIVMIGNMGTNNMNKTFEDDLNIYLDLAKAFGAKIMLNSYTPHGARDRWSHLYNPETQQFDCYRRDAYAYITEKVAKERLSKDPSFIGFVEIGKNANVIFNTYVADFARHGYENRNEAAQAIIDCYGDHNHYHKSPLVCNLMLNGYGTTPGIVEQLTNLLSANKNQPLYKNDKKVAVSLTFDDGLLEHYTEVFPRLQELGIKATFWLCGEKIDEGNFKGTPTMTWEMARKMAEAGMEMSNHGWSHTSVEKLDKHGILREAERNDSAIIVNTGIKPQTFCYPFNQHNTVSDSLLSYGRVGLRTHQVSLGGKQYNQQHGDLIALYEKAKATGEWLVTMTHGITMGYDNIAADTTALWKFIRHIANDKDCWVAPFGEISEYLTLHEKINLEPNHPATVIITAGQSNTDGRVLNNDLPEYVKANGYKHCYWSYGSAGQLQTDGFEPFWPKIANNNNPNRWAYDAVFYHLLEQALDEDFYVVKWSLGGTAINPTNTSTSSKYWSANPEWLSKNTSTLTGGKSLLLSFTEEIDMCIDNYLSKLDNGYEIKAFLWHQGESDRMAGDMYAENLKGVVEYVRKHLVEKTGNKSYENLPFICGTVARSNKQYNAEVENAMWQLQKEMKNFFVIDMSDAELQSDQLHFTAKSAEFLGKEMFKLFKKLNICSN